MVDTIQGDITTTATIAVGGAVSSELETVDDHDWFRIDLVAGQTITVSLNGTGGVPPDTYLQLHNSAGTTILYDDDGGPGYNSALQFTASASGSYYIDVGSYADSESGTYDLSVVSSTPLSTFTNDQIADQLINGYWNSIADSARHFDVGPGGSLDVNITALTAEGQHLAHEALALWSDITGITFNEVATAADIDFDDEDPGVAYSTSVTSGGFIDSSFVNVAVDWIDPALDGYGFELDSYSFQTYIHEIGHALGLGHAGNYNNAADYLTDAMYANDGWPSTVMSYFDQDDNFYFQSRGFSTFFAVTPMVADVLAMSLMYGLSTTTRAGNTTYGFGSDAGRDIFNASLNPTVSYTVFDSGGIDTLNYSGFAFNQRIDLRPEMFSNVGSGVGNVSIARGTLIENAIGGSGNDTITGNNANNQLTGGLGNDTLSGGLGDDTLFGGAGVDTVLYSAATGGVVVNLATGAAQNTVGAGIDTITYTENVTGSNFADRLSGSSGANILLGNGGNDALRGGVGNDTLNGGTGNDILEGGPGDDVLDGAAGVDIANYAAATAAVTVNLALTTVQNTVGAGNDRLVNFERLYGSNFNDTLTGGAAGEIITGRNGNDVINGGAGADKIQGDAGNDTLSGGTGNDTLYGGAGQDLFRFDSALAANVDTMADFSSADDTVQLSQALFAAIGVGTLAASAFQLGTAANDAADRIIYDQAKGFIYYDADGNGAGAKLLFARVAPGEAVANTDFVVIASSAAVHAGESAASLAAKADYWMA